MKSKLFTPKLSLIIGCLFYIAGFAIPVAADVYFHYQTVGSKVRIDAYGSFDTSVLSNHIFQDTTTGTGVVSLYDTNSAKAFVISGTQLSPPEKRASGKANISYSGTNSYTPDDENKRNILIFSGYTSDYYFFNNEDREFNMSGAKNTVGSFVIFDGGRVEFPGTLSQMLGDSSFDITLNVGSGNAERVIFSTDNPIPGTTPSGLTATAGTNSQTGLGDGTVTLSWTKATGDAARVISGYEYQQLKDNGSYGNWQDIRNSNANTTIHKVEGLDNGSTYKFKVRAAAGRVHGPESAEVSAQLDAAPTFGNATAGPFEWLEDTRVSATSLPTATGGNGTLTYQITPATAPSGMTFSKINNSEQLQISGTPDTAQTAMNYTLTVSDADGDTDTLTFTIAVAAQVPPVLPSETYDDQTYIKDSPIETFTLPTATGGNDELSYAITPRAPSGLIFEEILLSDGTKQMQISGTPDTVQAATEYTLTVSDGDGKTNDDTDSLTFNITVVDDTSPSFGSQTISALTYEQQMQITALQLPEATGGNGSLTYSVSGLPDGLTFTASNRRITGTPTTVQGATQYTYTATDDDNTSTTTDDDSVSLTFTITVTERDVPPTFGSETVGNQSYLEGLQIDTLTLPAATGGNVSGSYTYTLTSTTSATGTGLPAGLNWSARDRTITGTPTAEGVTTHIYTASDDDSNQDASDTVSLTFTITVEKDLRPMFAITTIYEVSLPRERRIKKQLPVASGGNGALEYSLDDPLPAGLTLNKSTGVITGEMAATVPLSQTSYAYTVKDSDKNTTTGDEHILDLRIIVVEPPPVDEELIETSMQQTLSETAGIISGVTMSSIRFRVQNYSAPQVSSSTSLNARDDRRWSSHVGREPVRMDADEFMRSGEFLSLVNAYTGNGMGDRSYLFWSDAAHNNFKDDSSALKYDGEVSGISFGVDTPLGEGVVGGVSLSRFTGKTEYTQSDGNTGRQKIRATSVSPYFGLRKSEYTMWTFVGVGSGNFRLEQDNLSETSDLSLNAVGVGGSTQVWSNAKTTVHLAGDFTLTELSVDASSGFIPEQDASVNRTRLVLEASQRHRTSEGGVVEPSVEFGVANDSGDGNTGSRIEVGAGMNYQSASQRVTLSLSSYGLLKRNNSSEWGVQGGIHMQPKESGGGMSFSLKPSYGAAVRGVDRIWDIGSTDDVAGDESYRPRLDADLSYGFRIIGDRGLLTPYSEVSLEGDDRTYRVGTRFRFDSKFELNLVGESVESADVESESSIHFQGGIRF